MSAKKLNKKIWCKVADIPENTIFMMGVPVRGFFDLWPKRGLGNYLHAYFTLFKGDFSEMCYVRKEFDEQADFLAKKMLQNTVWAMKIIDNVEYWSKEFFKVSRKQYQTNVKKLSNLQLANLLKVSFKAHQESHAIGASVSWHADAEKERITKYIIEVIATAIKRNNLNFLTPVIFSKLSTPLEQSYVEQEEVSFLKIAKQIKLQRKILKTFIYSDLDILEKELSKIDASLYKLIVKHYQNFCWLSYQYRGPAYSLSDFLSRWQAFLKEDSNPQKLLEQIYKKHVQIKKEQQQILKKLKLTKKEIDQIKLTQRLVFIKDFRKTALYHAMFCLEPLFKEIGRRLGLSFYQVTAMDYLEMIDAIKFNKFNPHDLNLRLKECAAYYDGKNYIVYTGNEFKKFIKNITFERKNIVSTNEMSGTCACPGLVQGTVKIINLPNQMDKMKKGDILVAHNTNPNLVPAMKLAGALVCEAGGLTCHTAIVARELKIPCVVGVPSVDKVLKDGDRVEVDATKGIIKKISN